MPTPDFASARGSSAAEDAQKKRERERTNENERAPQEDAEREREREKTNERPRKTQRERERERTNENERLTVVHAARALCVSGSALGRKKKWLMATEPTTNDRHFFAKYLFIYLFSKMRFHSFKSKFSNFQKLMRN